MNQLQGKFLLPQIYAFIQWIQMLVVLLEELISVLSVPLLSFGISTSLVDFFLHGSLSKDPQFALAWSIIQAVSIDAQIAYTWYKAKTAWSKRKITAFLGFLLIGLVIGFVVWAGSSLQGVTIASDGAQASTQTTTDAYGFSVTKTLTPAEEEKARLAKFGVSEEVLVGARQGVAVVLLCIAGWTRKLVAEVAESDTKNELVQVEKGEGFFAVLGRFFANLFTAFYRTITLKNLREKWAAKRQKTVVVEPEKDEQKSAAQPTTFVPENVSKSLPITDGNLHLVRTPKVTKKLTYSDAELGQRSNRSTTKKEVIQLPRLTKNLYTKVEAARTAKCRIEEIETALKTGTLVASKNGEKVLKSSLEKFIVERKKEQAKVTA